MSIDLSIDLSLDRQPSAHWRQTPPSGAPGTLDETFGEYRDGLLIYSEAGPGFFGAATRRSDGGFRFAGVHEDAPDCLALSDYNGEGFFERDRRIVLGGGQRRFIKLCKDRQQRVLLLGSLRDSQQAFCVRLLENAELDPDFGDNGEVLLDYQAPWVGYGRGLAVQADGRILLSLKQHGPCGGQGDVILRLEPNGQLDTSFAIAGVLGAARAGTAFEAIALQEDGKLLVAGSHDHQALLARYDAQGQLDPTFGCGGHLQLPTPGRGAFFAMVVQPDQAVVVVGTADAHAGVAMLTRIGSDGRPDLGFNAGLPLYYPGLGLSFAVAIQADGKIVSTQHAEHGSRTWLMRHLANGEADPGFGRDGLARPINISSSTSYLSHIELQPDGKILISGRYATHSCLARYHA